MPLSDFNKILYVAYPVLPVRGDSCGGAEQVLLAVEREAVRHGFQTTVSACCGSEAQGTVYSTGAPPKGLLTSPRQMEFFHSAQTLELISVRKAIGRGFDVVHDHSGSFFAHVTDTSVPVLATLHLPRNFYPDTWFARVPENVYFNCVSKAQARTFSGLRNLVGAVPNGISMEPFRPRFNKDDFLLWVGRICEEKAPHIALDLAAEFGFRLAIAGRVYPFQYHHEYFVREILPRLQKLGPQVKFLEEPSLKQKVELLRSARAVLITSQVDETSSLVAMEAAACGTPVIALRRGALPGIVRHGETGLLVNTAEQMAEAIKTIDCIRPQACSEHAQQHFSAQRMFIDYLQLYETIWARSARLPLAA
jgi:glycosyltransferase involved in cell wall biosynthesis